MSRRSSHAASDTRAAAALTRVALARVFAAVEVARTHHAGVEATHLQLAQPLLHHRHRDAERLIHRAAELARRAPAGDGQLRALVLER